MPANYGTAANLRLFYGTPAVRRVFEGSRRIRDFIAASKVASEFGIASTASASVSGGNITFTIKDKYYMSTITALDSCDDISFYSWYGSVSLWQMDGTHLISVGHSYNDVGTIVIKYEDNVVVSWKGGTVYNQKNTAGTFRIYYDFGSRTYKVTADGNVIYTSPVIDWQATKVSMFINFYYYPPYVYVVGYDVVYIPEIYIAGYVRVSAMNKAVGYPRPTW